MPKYVIEREIPGIGSKTPAELRTISQNSCAVLEKMGTKIQWIHSYVTDDKIYCVYYADAVETVKEHANRGGFPANSIAKVATMIEPVTAE